MPPPVPDILATPATMLMFSLKMVVSLLLLSTVRYIHLEHGSFFYFSLLYHIGSEFGLSGGFWYDPDPIKKITRIRSEHKDTKILLKPNFSFNTY